MEAFTDKNRITRDTGLNLSHHLGNASECIVACIELGKTKEELIECITWKPQEHLGNLKKLSVELDYIDEEDLLWWNKDVREELKKIIEMLENIPENPTMEFFNSVRLVASPLTTFLLCWSEKK